MSYNIDTFRLKKLENLVIPVASLFKHERGDWHPERTDGEETTFHNLGFLIKGTVQDGNLYVSKFCCYGEGSGTSMRWILEPALKDSRGELVVSFVWEGGDCINQLQVKDGDIKWVDIEI